MLKTTPALDAATGAAVYQLLYCTTFFGRCSGVGVDHWTWMNAGPGGVLFGILVMVIQWHRIRTSQDRVAAPAPVVVVPSTWDLQLSVQNKFRGVFIVLCILSMLMLFGHIVLDEPGARPRRRSDNDESQWHNQSRARL